MSNLEEIQTRTGIKNAHTKEMLLIWFAKQSMLVSGQLDIPVY